MISIKNPNTTDNQSRIVMPTYATFGGRTCAWTDVPARQHVSALVKGAPGVPVWSPPTC